LRKTLLWGCVTGQQGVTLYYKQLGNNMIIEMTCQDILDVVGALRKTITDETMKTLTEQELNAFLAFVEATQKSLDNGGVQK